MESSERAVGARTRASDLVWRRELPLWRRVPTAVWAVLTRPFRRGRENRYRDVWLVLISGLVLWTAVTAQNAASDAKQASDDAKNAAAIAVRASAQAVANVAAIQRSRIQITRQSCEDQNERNRDTIAKFDALVAKIKDPVQKAQARENAEASKSLIRALVPSRDCAKVVEKVRTAREAP